MILSPPRHLWVVTNTDTASNGLPSVPETDLDVRCHRLLRGPYTGGGTVMRRVVPELGKQHGELIAARANEVVALAPDLAESVPLAPRTLTNLANRAERTRFYSIDRTLHIAHGVAELLMDWARTLHPGGVVVAFREMDDADPTDRQLVTVLLRRCDPRLVTLVVETDGVPEGDLGQALAAYADRAAAPPPVRVEFPPDADLAQLFIDSDGTSRNPDLRRAYDLLPPDERARRHTARAELLATLKEPGSEFGAILYHLEHGIDPIRAGETINDSVEICFDRGCYDAALELSLRGRALFGDARPRAYWSLTAKVGASLSYMFRGQEGFAYFGEMRACSIDPEIITNSCYMMAMLYTRHLPKGMHDETRALEWVNIAIALADRHPDPHRRAFVGAFMRNARALVELHRGDLAASLALVNEAIAMTDADLGPNEQLLHRSVLLYNRAQVLAAMGDHAAALRDYDTVISRDPDYGDYYFERARERRVAGRYAEALADYAEAIRLSPPYYEVYYNRADLLRELGEDDAARRDLDYAILLNPTHVDSRVNRADLLLAAGDLDGARADIEAGLALDPKNANLLSAQGSLWEASGDTEAAFTSYTAALTEDPGFVAAWANRAVLSYSVGRLTEAIDDLGRAIEVGDCPELRINRAIALQELDDHGRALADLDVAIDALGDEVLPDLLFRRGVSRHALRDIDGARQDWSAHLVAYGPGETSPYLEQITARGGQDLVGQTAASPTG